MSLLHIAANADRGGEAAGELIDRKFNSVFTTARSKAQARAQSAALTLHNLKGVWEVDNQRSFNKATRMFSGLGITNITVRMV
jgi:hypothetical protein